MAKAGGKFIKREMTTAKKGRMVYWQRKPSSIGVGLDAHCTQRWEGGHDGCSANPFTTAARAMPGALNSSLQPAYLRRPHLSEVLFSQA